MKQTLSWFSACNSFNAFLDGFKGIYTIAAVFTDAVAGISLMYGGFVCELPVTPLAERGKYGLQSTILALAVETGTEGFDSPLS